MKNWESLLSNLSGILSLNTSVLFNWQLSISTRNIAFFEEFGRFHANMPDGLEYKGPPSYTQVTLYTSTPWGFCQVRPPIPYIGGPSQYKTTPNGVVVL